MAQYPATPKLGYNKSEVTSLRQKKAVNSAFQRMVLIKKYFFNASGNSYLFTCEASKPAARDSWCIR
jgi:hypothetical protein